MMLSAPVHLVRAFRAQGTVIRKSLHPTSESLGSAYFQFSHFPKSFDHCLNVVTIL